MRIVVVGVLSESLVTFRGAMLRAMAARGHEVLAVAPEDDDRVRGALSDMGVAFAPVPLQRTGMNPWRDLKTLAALTSLFRRFRADAVLVYAAKPVVYGLPAAWMARVPFRAAMITGAGSAFAPRRGARSWALSAALRGMYRLALRFAHLVFFQNPDDEALFRCIGLVGERHQVVRIAGSGVDLDHFASAPLPPFPVRFLMIGRLIRDKGVIEFVEAARRVRSIRQDARFLLLGPLDSNPSAISASDLERWRSEGVIEYLGATADVRPFLTDAHVCVLPSYGEGTPRSVLEAMAMGRPIIATDVPGCRQTVEPGANGLLVPAHNAAALADAMLSLISAPHELEAMGRHSRALAEERFDVRAVNKTILGAMGLP